MGKLEGMVRRMEKLVGVITVTTLYRAALNSYRERRIAIRRHIYTRAKILSFAHVGDIKDRMNPT